ncbi:MAG: CRISPR-associated endonuclease Cas2 [Bacteroidota bacterium]
MKENRDKTFIRKVKLIRKAGIKDNQYIDEHRRDDPLDSLEDRIEKVLQVYKRTEENPLHMIYFIMYDIENNKVRNQIAKYLLDKGCTRVQRSIYLTESDRKTYKEIHESLKAVQAMYDNDDSILIVPVSGDLIQSMKIIGQDVNLDMILGNQNTMFF